MMCTSTWYSSANTQQPQKDADKHPIVPPLSLLERGAQVILSAISASHDPASTVDFDDINDQLTLLVIAADDLDAVIEACEEPLGGEDGHEVDRLRKVLVRAQNRIRESCFCIYPQSPLVRLACTPSAMEPIYTIQSY
jgi:hypothetical protein